MNTVSKDEIRAAEAAMRAAAARLKGESTQRNLDAYVFAWDHYRGLRQAWSRARDRERGALPVRMDAR